MKYFSCQPDSHNAFGSLTNGVLTYFTVDCSPYKRMTPSGNVGAAAEPSTAASTSLSKSSGATAEGRRQGHSNPTYAASHTSSVGPLPSLDASGASSFLQGAYHESYVSTDTRMHIQRTLTLPSAFQSTPCCFSMANRTVFGTDMAFIGAANGLLALVVLREDLLLYIRGKDPQSLREQFRRAHADTASASRSASTASSLPGGPTAALSTSPANSLANASVHRTTTLVQAETLAFDPLAGEMEAPAFADAGVPTTKSSPSATATATAAAAAAADLLVYRRGAPSTITWMRDKPLVLVGYTSGWVEWYEVSLSSQQQRELMDPSNELPFRASVTPGAFAYQALNRDAHTSRVARVVVGGQKDGLRVELIAQCRLSDAGALTSSDYFPANGTVVVVGDSGGLFLFHTDQLEAPLCELNLNIPTAGFVYCHPFLPLIGVVSPDVWPDGHGGRRRRTGTGSSPTLRSVYAAERRRGPEASATPSPRLTDWRMPTGNPTALRMGGSGGVFPVTRSPGGASRAHRHVGWVDDDLCDGAGAISRDRSPFSRPGAGMRNSAASASPTHIYHNEPTHTGCVLSLVEYVKEPPPRQLSWSWAGSQAPTATHRLTEVLQHWVPSSAPRYGTSYNFSWKFSFDLELVVGNLEEGMLRIVRIQRTPWEALTEATASPTVAGVPRFQRPCEHCERESGGASALPDPAANSDSSDVISTVSGDAAHRAAYRVVQEYSVRLPQHSLVNVEYVSAATSALSSLDAATVAGTTGGADGRGGSPDFDMSETAALSTFRREAERHRRHSAMLAVAKAAADPRSRLGFTMASSGKLCRPVNPLWAGLAMVSLPHRRRHRHGFSAAGNEEEMEGAPAAGGYGAGSMRAAFDEAMLVALYDASMTGSSSSCGRARLIGGPNRAVGSGSGAAGGTGPQLKENALAVAMLQPLRGDYGVSGARRHRHHDTDTSMNSSYHTTTDALSSSIRPSSSGSTPQQQQQQRRKRRQDRSTHSPAISVPSYAAQSTQNEMANAVLIVAEQRVDLHQRLRIGPGNVSCVVGMNASGEVTSVPIEVRAVATWHEEGSLFVGLGPTTYAADLVSIQGIERLMRLRHAAGFGISAMANLVATREVGGYGSDDVILLFSYIATLESMTVVSSTGPVPSFAELLRGTTARSRRISAQVMKEQPCVAPRMRYAMQECIYHNNLRRLVVLKVLDWLPRSLAEEWVASAAAATAVQVPEVLLLPFEGAEPLGEANTDAEIERAVAVEVTHARYNRAAELLLRFGHRSASYKAVATLLQCPSQARALVQESDVRVCASFRASLSPWLLVVFHCLCGNDTRGDPVEGDYGLESSINRGSFAVSGAAAPPPPTALPLDLYRHSALNFWDRVALAVVMEDEESGAISYVLRAVLLPQCSPIQALVLHHGIHLRTCAVMQEIVDCTGDFQLGACLFARVGVLTTAAAYAFPFLLDAVVLGANGAAVCTERALTINAFAAGLSGGGVGNASCGFPSGSAGAVMPTYFEDHSLQHGGMGSGCGRAGLIEEACGEAGVVGLDDQREGSLRDERDDSSFFSDGSGSPYAYLYGGDIGGSSGHNGGVNGGASGGGSAARRRRSTSQPTSLIASPCSPLDGAMSHTAWLVRNSALPPPPLSMSRPVRRAVTNAAAAAGASTASATDKRKQDATASSLLIEGGRSANESPDGIPTHRKGQGEGAVASAGWSSSLYRDTVAAESDTNTGSDGLQDSDDKDRFSDSEGDEEADEPWVWWAAAYRSLLDDEQAFVKRTTFDVECQQLRGRAFAQEALLARRDNLRSTGAVAMSRGVSGLYSISSRHRSPIVHNVDAAGRRVLPSPDGRLLSVPGSRRTNSRPTRSDLVSPSPPYPYASAALSPPRGYSRVNTVSTAEFVAGGSMSKYQIGPTDTTSSQQCVCGDDHPGTQLVRSLLNLCRITPTRCSVCLQPVRLGAREVDSAFAWCTACRHGGHAHHLQDWFRKHRRCPVSGCECHCDEDSSLF